jgi:uncharacterized cupin superfamily protein
MPDYTQTNLREVEDAAVKGGFSEYQEARFANDDLDLETLGVSYQVVKPGKHHAFGHRHKKAEEVYVVLAGPGRSVSTTTRSTWSASTPSVSHLP